MTFGGYILKYCTRSGVMKLGEQTDKLGFGGAIMNKKELLYIAILSLIIAFMDISGIPSVFFVNIQITDIEPMYFTLMINFVIIGIIAYIYLKLLCPAWKLGFSRIGLVDGLKKYGLSGAIIAIVGFVAFYVGLALLFFKYKWVCKFDFIHCSSRLYYLGHI